MTIALERALFSIPPEGTESEAVRQLGLPTTPSNRQIMDGAKSAYGTYQSAVDAATLALIDSVRDPSLSPAVARLDGINWSSQGLTAAFVDPFLKSVHVQTAVGVAKATDLASFSVGVFTKNLPAGGPGVVGFDGDLCGREPLGFTLQLDIFGSIVHVDNTSNLQYGVWREQAAQLHDRVLGFYAKATVRAVGVNLEILLDSALNPYGFLVSIGATVPVASGIFAGSTARWSC